MFGFYALVSAIEGRFVHGAVAIIIAGMFDQLDGKIARATNTTSAFGVEYDSLADLMSFGVAPSIMVYLWALKLLGRIGWLAAFLFTVCGALRLARFNTQTSSSGSEYFTGLPIPAAAGLVATTILFYVAFCYDYVCIFIADSIVQCFSICIYIYISLSLSLAPFK